MFYVGPRPYLIGQSNIRLDYARQPWIGQIPNDGWWVFKFLTVAYTLDETDGVQSTPNLSFRMYDADGRDFSVRPVLFSMMTSPAGAKGLNATNLINVRYPGGSSVKLEILGADPGGDGPDSISITLFGIRSEGMIGG